MDPKALSKTLHNRFTLVPLAVQEERSWEALLRGPQGINPL